MQQRVWSMQRVRKGGSRINSIHRYYYAVWVEFTVANLLTISLNLESVSRNKDTRSLVLTADTTPWMGLTRVFILATAEFAVSRASSTAASADTGVPPTEVWV